jgi:transcriptional regulator
MYLPAHFEQADRAAIARLIADAPLARVVSFDGTRLHVDLVPLQLRREDDRWRLVGHVARANPLWRHQAAGVEVLAVFEGPQHYVSPGWYPSKREHGKVVPTWNYVVAELRGPLTAIDDRDWLRALLDAQVDQAETRVGAHWRVDDAPADYIERLLGAIVGIEIAVTAHTGKWKLSQNHPVANRDGVVDGLEGLDDPAAASLAAAMRTG